MTKPHPTPNDQRAIVKNPNNAAYDADRRNRIELGHDDAEPDPHARSSLPPKPHRPTHK